MVPDILRMLIVVWLTLSASSTGRAKDYFLTIGGGYSPEGNQASIESNVLFCRRTLEEQRPDRPQHTVFFSDGDAATRDVQVLDQDQRKKCPPARRIMTELFGDERSIGVRYRNHRVDDIAGGTDRRAISRKFHELGRELKAGDRLIVYVTGHGAESGDNQGDDNYDYRYDEDEGEWVAKLSGDFDDTSSNEYDTSLLLWDNEPVSASEFSRWLDRVPREVTVVLVMVQCYSGGFAHAVFRQNDQELGLSPCRRCGFFAQVHDRPAAGCTDDAQEADYEEYSTYFWTALGGKTRTGKKIKPPDYNGDGTVSFAEAHAYAVIETRTIDIPIRASDELLRRYSRLAEDRGDEADSSPGDTPIGFLFGTLAKAKAAQTSELLQARGPLADLASKARPDQRAILERLSKRLDLGDRPTVEQVRQAASRAETNLELAAGKAGVSARTLDTARDAVKRDVCELWPELAAGYSPATADLTEEHADEFVAAVEALGSYDALRAARDRQDKLSEEFEAAQKTDAAAHRLIWTIDSIALAANLEKTAPAEVVNRYAEMVRMEEGLLVATDLKAPVHPSGE